MHWAVRVARSRLGMEGKDVIGWLSDIKAFSKFSFCMAAGVELCAQVADT